jgi:hypothetical protein
LSSEPPKIKLSALSVPEKVALVPAKGPVNVPPVKGKYGPPITVEAATQVGAALPFDFNICPEVP